MRNKVLKLVRPLDMVLIIFFTLASFIPWAIFTHQQRHINSDAPRVAIVSIAGNEVARFELYENAEYIRTFTAADGLTGNQYNIVEISGYQIRVQADNSPDQVGVNMGWISNPGQTIVVLPHRFLIRIEATPLDDDIIIPF